MAAFLFNFSPFLQARLDIAALRLNAGMLAKINGDRGTTYGHGNRGMVLQASSLRQQTRAILRRASTSDGEHPKVIFLEGLAREHCLFLDLAISDRRNQVELHDVLLGRC